LLKDGRRSFPEGGCHLVRLHIGGSEDFIWHPDGVNRKFT